MTTILIIIAAIILFILLVCLLIFHIAMDSKLPVPMDGIVPADHMRMADYYRNYIEKLPHEDISVTSFDGLKLVGHFYPYTKDKPEEEPTGAYERYAGTKIAGDSTRRLVIMCHGWRSKWWIDYEKHFHWIRAMGSDILLIDERGCGESEGRFLTFGVNESKDILLWAETMHQRFPQKPIYLFGTSLGGGSVLQTISGDMPDYIRGIIADSAFTSPYELFSSLAGRWFHIPAHPVVDIVCWYTKSIGKADSNCKSSCKRIVEKIAADEKSGHPMRLILIHGDNDNLVDYHMSEANYAAAKGNENVKYLFVPGAGHCKGYEKATDAYENMVSEMFAAEDSQVWH